MEAALEAEVCARHVSAGQSAVQRSLSPDKARGFKECSP